MASTPTPSTIHQLVLDLTWTCLSTCPARQRHPIFTAVLSPHTRLKELLSSATSNYAPGLFEVLQASTPPPISYLKTLPTESKKRWAVYLLVLERTGSRPLIYIGSGTEARYGVSNRLSCYDTDTLVPRHVSRALKQGYTISNKGLVCWTPVPTASMVPTLRVLLVALETLFTFHIWAMYCTTDFEFEMTQLCPWDRDTLEYTGLCSHNPLMELPAGDHGLSSEKLESQASNKKLALNANVRRCEEKAKKIDPEGYAAKKAATSRTRREKHPGAIIKADKRCIAKAVKQKTHYCPVCDHAFTKKTYLAKHLAGPKHAVKVTQQKEGVKNPELYCAVCNQQFTRKATMDEHFAGPRHAAKVARLNDDVVGQQN